MVDDVQKAWGRVDVLVANAGGGRGRPPGDHRDPGATGSPGTGHPDELLRHRAQLQRGGPGDEEQRSGRIVTVASYAGSVAGAGGGYAHYGANKAAIAHYTRYLAQELGPYGINANCIAPGFIATARIVQLAGGRAGDNDQARHIPLRRVGEPEDCAKVVEFLATDLSDYVTGALIPIDGGWNRAG